VILIDMVTHFREQVEGWNGRTGDMGQSGGVGDVHPETTGSSRQTNVREQTSTQVTRHGLWQGEWFLVLWVFIPNSPVLDWRRSLWCFVHVLRPSD